MPAPSLPRPLTRATGYLSPAYGESFRSVGQIVTLPDSGLALIRREICPGMHDLIGLYPYAMCADFAALPADAPVLQASGAVAVSFVADPFQTDVVRAALAHWTVCRRFKTQFVIDLARDWRAERTKNTRYYVRKGQQTQSVETVTAQPSQAPMFWQLYRNTIARHAVSGIQALSESIIADQLDVPGAFLVLSRIGDTVTGAMLSYVHASHANAHLICFDETHYAARTSYVLIDAAAAHAENLGCRWFNLGGPAGLADDPEDGLYQFKRRWTAATRETTLCGQVLDRAAYDRLCTAAKCDSDTGFFPAYRHPGSPYEWRALAVQDGA